MPVSKRTIAAVVAALLMSSAAAAGENGAPEKMTPADYAMLQGCITGMFPDSPATKTPETRSRLSRCMASAKERREGFVDYAVWVARGPKQPSFVDMLNASLIAGCVSGSRIRNSDTTSSLASCTTAAKQIYSDFWSAHVE